MRGTGMPAMTVGAVRWGVCCSTEDSLPCDEPVGVVPTQHLFAPGLTPWAVGPAAPRSDPDRRRRRATGRGCAFDRYSCAMSLRHPARRTVRRNLRGGRGPADRRGCARGGRAAVESRNGHAGAGRRGDARGGGSRHAGQRRVYLPAKTPAPAVLLAHGFGGSKTDLDSEARSLAEHGFVVLAYTARGFGRSGGLIHLDRAVVRGRRTPAG